MPFPDSTDGFGSDDHQKDPSSNHQDQNQPENASQPHPVAPETQDPLPTSFFNNEDPLPTSFFNNEDPLPTSFFNNEDPLPTSFFNEDPLPTSFFNNEDPLPTSFFNEDPLPTSFFNEDPLPTSFFNEDPLPTSFFNEDPLSTSFFDDEDPLPNYTTTKPIVHQAYSSGMLNSPEMIARTNALGSNRSYTYTPAKQHLPVDTAPNSILHQAYSGMLNSPQMIARTNALGAHSSGMLDSPEMVAGINAVGSNSACLPPNSGENVEVPNESDTNARTICRRWDCEAVLLPDTPYSACEIHRGFYTDWDSSYCWVGVPRITSDLVLDEYFVNGQCSRKVRPRNDIRTFRKCDFHIDIASWKSVSHRAAEWDSRRPEGHIPLPPGYGTSIESEQRQIQWPSQEDIS